MDQQSSQDQQFQVKANDEILKGVYANMLQVGHSREEFVLDFINLFPPTGILTSRVIVSPGHMKRLVLALQENIKSYEGQFGEVKVEQEQKASIVTSSSNQKFGFDTATAK